MYTNSYPSQPHKDRVFFSPQNSKIKKLKYAPYKLTQPVSKNWFYNQFKAEGITYEVGDDTPENIIKDKAQKAAILMMSILVNTDN